MWKNDNILYIFLREALISTLHRMTLVKSSAESLPSLPDYPPQEISPRNPLSGWVGGYWGKLSKNKYFTARLTVSVNPPPYGKLWDFFCVFDSRKWTYRILKRILHKKKKWMIICKRLTPSDYHLQEASPSGWSCATTKRAWKMRFKTLHNEIKRVLSVKKLNFNGKYGSKFSLQTNHN